MNVLVVADESRGAISDLTYELISAGATLGSVAVLVVANEPEQFTPSVSRDGVDEIVLVSIEETGFDSDSYRHALEQAILLRRPDITLVASSTSGRTVGPAVAARLGLGFASDIHGLNLDGNQVIAERSFYSELAIGTLEFASELGTLLLLRPGSWPSATGLCSPRVIELDLPATPSRTRHLEYIEPLGDDGIDISQADVILALGRGIGSRENVEMMQPLAERMGAVLAGSRPVIDAGWLPPSRLVGQSGATVSPQVYLALGVSGAVQHLSGVKGGATIVAVNQDESAGIFEAAQHGAVMDLFDVIEELKKLYLT